MSVRKAARDMYPVSSKIEMQRKRITIRGTKENTPPTPPIIPSISRERKNPSGSSIRAKSAKEPNNVSRSAAGYSPRAKVSLKIPQIIRKKRGSPRKWFIVRRSINSVGEKWGCVLWVRASRVAPRM